VKAVKRYLLLPEKMPLVNVDLLLCAVSQSGQWGAWDISIEAFTAE